MRLCEALVKNAIPSSYIKNGMVFKTIEPTRKCVFLGSVCAVVDKILKGETFN